MNTNQTTVDDLRRITDHARASVFTIHENVYPGAKDARYVIRRLIRRAVLDGYQMNLREPFLYKLTEAVAEFGQRCLTPNCRRRRRESPKRSNQRRRHSSIRLMEA